eukprot:GCRY01001028.1.p1 GENE.GCRY01001028.1~~GCRY01001028.1.p1  ORF type:complete len:423 (+),score=74.57 GCRY01001028.1:64-1332(+)
MVLSVVFGLLFVFFVLKFYSLCGKPSLFYRENGCMKTIVQKLPILSQTFRPTFWLPTGHMQCVATSFRSSPKIKYERELFETSDGGVLGLDYYTKKEVNDSSPILILLHGLTGNTREPYMRAVASLFAEKGWRTVGMNCRGCGGVRLRTHVSYCAAWSADFKEVATVLKSKYPSADLFGIGFSLGSIMIGKALSEWGEECPLKGAVLVSNPMELHLADLNLKSDRFSRLAYTDHLAKRLMSLVVNNREVFHDFIPEEGHKKDLKTWTLNDYENFLTCPTFNYENRAVFYRDASTVFRLSDIRVPTLCISARDDPFMGVIPEQEAAESSHVLLCVTESGGHVAFFDTLAGPFGGTDCSWADRVALDFLALLHNSTHTDESEFEEHKNNSRVVPSSHFSKAEKETANSATSRPPRETLSPVRED